MGRQVGRQRGQGAGWAAPGPGAGSKGGRWKAGQRARGTGLPGGQGVRGGGGAGRKMGNKPARHGAGNIAGDAGCGWAGMGRWAGQGN